MKKEINKIAERLAIDFVRIERKAIYGDMKPVDKTKRLRQELNLAYKAIEAKQESAE